MYASCLHCHAPLGANQVVEHLPIGQRLAFDEALGRLWVVCPRCLRWNLTPFDERLEAIEECEKLFRASRLRMSTDNIGLAKAPDGTTLVRVGNALRPEMAAWRFGAELAKRRRRNAFVIAGGVVGAAGLLIGVKVAGFGLVGGNWSWNLMKGAYERATRVMLPHPTLSRPLAMHTAQAHGSRFVMGDAPHDLVMEFSDTKKVRVLYHGDRLRAVAPKILAKVNKSGRSRDEEKRAIEFLTRAVDPGEPDLFSRLVSQHRTLLSSGKPLKEYAGSFALALEMALQEDRERAALAGELLELEAAWREAEELANIADSLVPSSVDRALVALKGRLDGTR